MSLNQKNENFPYYEIREEGCFCFILGKVRMARNRRKKTLTLKFMKKGVLGGVCIGHQSKYGKAPFFKSVSVLKIFLIKHLFYTARCELFWHEILYSEQSETERNQE